MNEPWTSVGPPLYKKKKERNSLGTDSRCRGLRHYPTTAGGKDKESNRVEARLDGTVPPTIDGLVNTQKLASRPKRGILSRGHRGRWSLDPPAEEWGLAQLNRAWRQRECYLRLSHVNQLWPSKLISKQTKHSI